MLYLKHFSIKFRSIRSNSVSVRHLSSGDTWFLFLPNTNNLAFSEFNLKELPSHQSVIIIDACDQPLDRLDTVRPANRIDCILAY